MAASTTLLRFPRDANLAPLSSGNAHMEIVIVLVLIVLHGFLVLGEIALLTAKRSRLEGEKLKGNGNAAVAVALLDDIDNYLSAMQIGITLISIVEGAYAGVPSRSIWSQSLPDFPSWFFRLETSIEGREIFGRRMDRRRRSSTMRCIFS